MSIVNSPRHWHGRAVLQRGLLMLATGAVALVAVVYTVMPVFAILLVPFVVVAAGMALAATALEHRTWRLAVIAMCVLAGGAVVWAGLWASVDLGQMVVDRTGGAWSSVTPLFVLSRSAVTWGLALALIANVRPQLARVAALWRIPESVAIGAIVLAGCGYQLQLVLMSIVEDLPGSAWFQADRLAAGWVLAAIFVVAVGAQRVREAGSPAVQLASDQRPPVSQP